MAVPSSFDSKAWDIEGSLARPLEVVRSVCVAGGVGVIVDMGHFSSAPRNPARISTRW